MTTYIRNGIVAFMFAALLGAAFALTPMYSAHAQEATSTPSTGIEAMLAQINALLEQVKSLQQQLAALRGEVRDVIKDGLSEGMTDDDIAKIQELLATDPKIYPEGLVTGYFGPLTKKALIRFQARHGATSTGEIDEGTRALLEEYLTEAFGDNIPPGLLRAPGIIKKVELRFIEGCENSGHGKGPLCKKVKIKYESDEDGEELEIEEEDESEDDDNATSSEEDAQDAIDDAQAAIDEAQEEIDNVATATDTSEAESILADAESKLDEAQDAFDDENWDDAESLAEEAEDLAEDAEDALDEDDDSEEDDEDDNATSTDDGTDE